MKPRVLLVNPPIYDFSAYDFWLKPYGMLRLAGFLRRRAEFCLVDFLDRLDSRVPVGNYRSDPWGRGAFYSEPVEKPAAFGGIPREFRRYGLPRDTLQGVLGSQSSFDYALVQTGMTYWYPGVREVVGEIRRLAPATKIILGGVYATLCPAHARSLGVDLVVEGSDLGPLWRFIGMAPEADQLPLWDLYPKLQTGVLKLADGCPFRCTYCSVPQVDPRFRARPLDHSLAELSFLYKLGVRDVAFYDDALLYRPAQVLGPFLREALRRGIQVRFHTPNAMNARFIDKAMACLLIAAGFKNIYLGFESSAYAWQKKTGGKVYSEELERAVENLVSAGADVRQLHTYLIAGHPNDEEQAVEDSMRFAHELGLRVMLSEFSPIPGTPDGESCRRWIDMDEPLGHNKTAFAIQRLGVEEINRLKTLGGRLNRKLGQDYAEAGSRSLLQTDPGLLIGRQVSRKSRISGNFSLKEPSNTSELSASDSISDAICVRRLQRGDINAFEILVRRHEKAIFNLLYRMLGDYDDAAETSQEVFLSAYRAIGHFRGEANFSTWLYRIAINHATTRRKSVTSRQRKQVPFDGSEMIDDSQLGPAESLEKKELRERVQRALNELEPEDATVILLRDLQDTPYEEVAQVLEIPVGTVKSRLHRARQALKARLATYFSAGRKVI